MRARVRFLFAACVLLLAASFLVVSLRQADDTASLPEAPAETTSAPVKRTLKPVPRAGDTTPEAPANAKEPLIAYLEPSADPEDQLLLLAIRGPSGASVRQLRELLAYTSRRAMVLYLIAQAEQDGQPLATEQELAALKVADPNNALVDDLLAERAYRKGNAEQALHHLQNAADAPANRSYLVETLEMLGSALLRRNGYLTAGDFAEIMGYASAYPISHLHEISQLCRDNSGARDWRQTCAARGKALVSHGETLLDTAVGAELAATYAEGWGSGEQGSESQVAPWTQYSQQAQSTLLNLGQQLEEKMSRSGVVLNSQDWQGYIEVYKEQGEVAALAYLVSLFP
ncbi:hypothetical protein [Gilvimarinus algae]|uniref:Secreted protein n=1 Tax=Gilvimarinus algae TaxID=3058037 RepID=A0ABT8TDB6_9GAMM|nr:hypothetical protein [Gilvimarinus sp. SDUM040014]MDO3382023.1 hypothetical protein [Gilvimarinus sp. SDUM040014]